MIKKLLILANVFILILAPSLAAEETANSLMIKGIEFAKSKRYGEAIQQYKAVLEIEPKNTKALMLAGLAYVNLNKPNEAVQYTKKATELDPSYATFYNLGLIYAASNQAAKALEALNQALVFNSKSYEAEYQKGLVYSIQKDYEGAALAYQRSIELNPDFEKAHIGLVGSEYRKGDKKQALAHIEELKSKQKIALAKELEKWIEKQP